MSVAQSYCGEQLTVKRTGLSELHSIGTDGRTRVADSPPREEDMMILDINPTELRVIERSDSFKDYCNF